MAADETQSLEYKSIPNTYQSVVFVNNTNNVYSFYTGDGWVLPLSANDDYISFDGDINVTDTLSSNNISCITRVSSDTSTFTDFDGTSINNKSSITAVTNKIDWNNPKSILTDGAVIDEYNKFSINLTPLMLESANISCNTTSVTATLTESATIVYIIPCLVTTKSNDTGSSITLQATCNGIKSNIAQLTINTYFEKWRDNPEALREESTICSVEDNICTIIGYTHGVSGDNIIQISASDENGISNWSIDEDNILILSR